MGWFGDGLGWVGAGGGSVGAGGSGVGLVWGTGGDNGAVKLG